MILDISISIYFYKSFVPFTLTSLYNLGSTISALFCGSFFVFENAYCFIFFSNCPSKYLMLLQSSNSTLKSSSQSYDYNFLLDVLCILIGVLIYLDTGAWLFCSCFDYVVGWFLLNVLLKTWGDWSYFLLFYLVGKMFLLPAWCYKIWYRW